MSAVALRCDADADRMLAHLRERFAEVFPVTGSAGDGAGGDAGGNPDEGADGSADAAVRFAPVADRGSFAFASAPGRLEVAGNHVDHQGGRVGLQGAGDQDQVGEVCRAFVLAHVARSEIPPPQKLKLDDAARYL